ncbi:MAG TPA: heme-binding protein, partial [Rhizomicrobium sp.]|nr:heme-binding protein [Rhizomicrobium sp.]
MRLATFAIATSLAAAPALAQPLPVPASYPPVVGEKGVVTTHEISLDMAEKIARAGIDACRKMGFHTTMVVIDSGGTMKAFLRDDKTGPHTVTLAQDKAFTALTLASRFATSATFATARNSTLGSPMTNIRGVVGVGGGVPI